jgi:hypothetical protein
VGLLVARTSVDAQDRVTSPILGAQVRLAQQNEEDSQEPADHSLSTDFLHSPLLDSNVTAAAWQPPPALSQPATPATQPAPRTARATQFGNLRLASAPNMFGDQPTSTAIVIGRGVDGQSQAFASTFSLPTGGGGSRMGKIAENDSPIPQDRVFFNYNHFHNVFELTETPFAPPGPTVFRQQSMDRYTVGFEKTFHDGWTSVEVRMPIIGTFDTELESVGIAGTGNAGNLTVVLKSLVSMTDTAAVGAGMAIETPTGSDVITRLGDSRIRFENDAAHLLPYIGFIWAPGDPQWGWNDGWFFSGFAQVDLNTAGSPVSVLGPNSIPTTQLGLLNDQNLGFLDIAAGYWLYRDPSAWRLTGLAAITELHYTTTLQDADVINGTVNGAAFSINSIRSRFDVLNATVGLQFLIHELSSLRVAGVFPIGDEDDRRLFDSEIQVQFNRRF